MVKLLKGQPKKEVYPEAAYNQIVLLQSLIISF